MSEWIHRFTRVETSRALVAAVVLIASTAFLVTGCFGGDDGTSSTAPVTVGQVATTTTTTIPDAGTGENDALSTFRSKDPFISQIVTESTAPTTAPTSGTVTTRPNSGGTTVTTITRPTTTTGHSTSTTKPSGSTTTTKVQPSTTTTAPHVHTLKVLSVGQVSGGAATVTLQVDSSVYKDKRIGDVVSTSWGQIKVLDINASSKVVTLLHGSETLNLIVGQVVYQ